jgi:hydrogenase nickel incorporation protein HypA/HybF
MHELSIVYSVVSSVTEALAGRKVAKVNSVLLRVGALSGIMEDPLQFGWSIATEETPLAGSALLIESVPVTVRCRPCGRDVVLDGMQSFRCPICGELCPEVVTGRELEIVSLEIEEDGDDAHSGAAAGNSEKERPAGG